MSADVVPGRPASTVIILRDRPGGPEVFLVRRHHAIAFMAGAHVFPGGRVDPADGHADATWCDLPSWLGDPRCPALSFVVAAARELFEEAGVLLARDHRGRFLSLQDPVVGGRFDGLRADVHAGTRTLRDCLESERLRLALDACAPFAHWITPPIEIRRFDTWFFLARVPPEQEAAHEPIESTDSAWLTPSAALSLARRGSINLPPPTWATLRELEPFTSSDAAIRWAQARPILTRQPRVVDEQGARVILLPGDPEFPSDEHDVMFETRFIWAQERWQPEVYRE